MSDSRSAPFAGAPGLSGLRDRGGEFYVGYLPMPRGLLRFVTGIAIALLIGMTLLACVLARTNGDPGDGVWNTGAAQTFEGLLVADPYPHLRIARDSGEVGIESLLLVEMGKYGGGQRAAPLNGKRVRVSGWLLERDGRRMIEMEPSGGASQLSISDQPLETLPPAVRQPTHEPLGELTARGEIVDSKCFLGAMKPGHGKTHKECATLCIAGGIPPMLVTRNAAGERRYILLCDRDGRALDRRLLPFVADPVELRGKLERCDDLLLLCVDPNDIRRL